MPDLPSHLHPVFWYTNVAFIIFAIYIKYIYSIDIFATYLQGENLCKSITITY